MVCIFTLFFAKTKEDTGFKRPIFTRAIICDEVLHGGSHICKTPMIPGVNSNLYLNTNSAPTIPEKFIFL